VLAVLGAIADAWRRIRGEPSWLGSPSRAGRRLGYVQLVVALGALSSLVAGIV
jgi:hypothetical protein